MPTSAEAPSFGIRGANRNDAMVRAGPWHSFIPTNSIMVQDNSPLKKLFEDQVADVLYAERRIKESLPKMAREAQSPALKQAFEHHLTETEKQIERLERVCGDLGKSTRGKKCHAILGIIEEAEELIEENSGTSGIDSALIAAAQKVEHYEIASYGTLISWAKQLKLSNAVDLMLETLEEEKTADGKLTKASAECDQVALKG